MSWQNPDQEDARTYKVVLNHEEQYSIWPADRENALGWSDAGKVGGKEECLAYIEEAWTDMRPLSLRKKMEKSAASPPPPPASTGRAGGDDLLGRLCEGEHPLEADLRPEKTAAVFKEALDRGYLPLTFTDTRGGTRLRVRFDRGASDLSGVDFEKGAGTMGLVGWLTLDGAAVKCVATIDMQTLAGRGRLERVEAREGA